MAAANLCAHAGAARVTRGDVLAVATPNRTATWVPIDHARLLEEMDDWVRRAGLEVRKEAHALSHNGARYFGVFDIAVREGAADYGLAVGLRNSHDMRFPAGLAVGSRVFVCDNLAFSGEVTLARKHTTYILRDLPRLCAEAFGRVGRMRERQALRIDAYKRTALTDSAVHDLLIKSVDCKVIPNAQIPRVLEEWRKPAHAEFGPRTAWSLFNAYTETAKEWNPFDLPQRTQRLHGLLDTVAHVN